MRRAPVPPLQDAARAFDKVEEMRGQFKGEVYGPIQAEMHVRSREHDHDHDH